jgi:hypothetical protein
VSAGLPESAEALLGLLNLLNETALGLPLLAPVAGAYFVCSLLNIPFVTGLHIPDREVAPMAVDII